ncbi:hypothetical protein KCV03_g84, partial [Aureobasidium melanogenum]
MQVVHLSVLRVEDIFCRSVQMQKISNAINGSLLYSHSLSFAPTPSSASTSATFPTSTATPAMTTATRRLCDSRAFTSRSTLRLSLGWLPGWRRHCVRNHKLALIIAGVAFEPLERLVDPMVDLETTQVDVAETFGSCAFSDHSNILLTAIVGQFFEACFSLQGIHPVSKEPQRIFTATGSTSVMAIAPRSELYFASRSVGPGTNLDIFFSSPHLLTINPERSVLHRDWEHERAVLMLGFVLSISGFLRPSCEECQPSMPRLKVCDGCCDSMEARRQTRQSLEAVDLQNNNHTNQNPVGRSFLNSAFRKLATEQAYA